MFRRHMADGFPVTKDAMVNAREQQAPPVERLLFAAFPASDLRLERAFDSKVALRKYRK
jgi:hypothetical protein